MFCFLVVNMQSLWSLLLLGMLCGSGHAICVPTISALMLERFPNESRGMGSTLTIMFSDMGLIVGAPIMGTIAMTFGYEYLFVVAGLITVTATIYFGWMTIPGWYKKLNSNKNLSRW
jgi:MFS family permease